MDILENLWDLTIVLFITGVKVIIVQNSFWYNSTYCIVAWALMLLFLYITWNLRLKQFINSGILGAHGAWLFACRHLIAQLGNIISGIAPCLHTVACPALI